MIVRRSALFVPGNNPGMLQTAGLFGADVVILDLEDAVAPNEKDAARELVARALVTIDYGQAQKCVRLNSLDTFCADDLKEIVPSQPDLLMLPKVHRASDIKDLAGQLDDLERPSQKRIEILAIIESPQGLAEVYEIARSHYRLMGLLMGAEDYTAMVGSLRTKGGEEIAVARSLLVNACAAAGIESFDAVFTDANDEEGLIKDTKLAKNLGFTGKGAINPRQVKPINETFNPSATEIDYARRILKALRQAEKEGSGVASVGGKMVDAPVAKRAVNVMNLARRLKLIGQGDD
ncbi:MAG: CoA ester lyase [Deltaproteobacteria bacterium]|jgi:citrate lyase subunit beta/citryl-CoA lyase|nr:CoA ester lyase [Deltaproteobacteria bacterium]